MGDLSTLHNKEVINTMRPLRLRAATAALAGASITLGLAAVPAYAAATAAAVTSRPAQPAHTELGRTTVLAGGHWHPQVTNNPNSQ
jgi:hypothetical protein